MFFVTGATGGIGRRVVRLLRERETLVRAVGSLLQRVEHRGAELFIGDLQQEKIFKKLARNLVHQRPRLVT